VGAPPESQQAPPLSEPEKGQRTWYGWQILVSDAASAATFLAGAKIDSSGVVGLGVAGYLAGGPAIHFGHGSFARGMASLGFRVGAPIGGALIGGLIVAAFTNNSSTSNSAFVPAWVVGAAFGFSIGVISAPILDATLLAYDQKHSPDTASRTPAPTLRLAPVAGLPRDANGHTVPTVGVAGVF
jgi:hypothetical protein